MNAEPSTALDEAELTALQQSIADVLESECDSRKVHVWQDRENDLGPALWRLAVELGWLGLSLPEADGGLGLGARGLQILNRELGRYVAPGGFIPTLCVAQWLASVADSDQRAALLGPMLAGEAAFAVPVLLEGSGAAVLGENSNGVSGSIDVLDCAAGSVATIHAVVPVPGAWAVVRIDDATARTESIEPWDLTRDISRLECKGAPIVARIADADGRAGTLLGTYLALALAADSVGGADGIARKTVEYLKERVQFDRVVASFQALKHRSADLVGHITTQDALLEQAVQCIDNGSPDAAMWTRLAKSGASDAFVFIGTDCIVLHGGVGHTWEYDPQIYIKRARLNEALLCNNRAARDTAVRLLDEALDQGRTTTELDW